MKVAGKVTVGTARMRSTSGEINVVGLVKAEKLVEIETISGGVSTRNDNGHPSEKVRNGEKDGERETDRQTDRETEAFSTRIDNGHPSKISIKDIRRRCWTASAGSLW